MTKKIILALLTGIMISLSFPKWNLWFLSWVAWVPMFGAIQGCDFRKSFLLGWISGFAAFCGILYWLVPTFQAAGVSNFIALLVTALLAGYIGLYYGIFAAISQSLFLRDDKSSG